MLRSKCTRLFNSTVSSFLNEVNSLRCSLNMEHLILCILSLSLFFFLSLYHSFSHFFPALSIPNDEKVNLIKKFRFLNTSFHFRSFSQSFNVPKWHKNEVWLLRINPNMSFFPLSISLTHSPTHPVLSPHMKYRFRLVTCKMLFVDCIRRSRTKPRASGCKFTCKTCNFVSG